MLQFFHFKLESGQYFLKSIVVLPTEVLQYLLGSTTVLLKEY